MIDALRFVQGATKSIVLAPELEHYQIRDGRIVGFNGYMALSSPIDLEISAKPRAKLFQKALQSCGETVSLGLMPSGRLHVKSGGFSAFIPCHDDEIYEAQPEGEEFPAPAGMLSAMRRLYSVISSDASRPWAMGLSVGGGAYTATNNIAILQVWEGHGLPTFNCPRFAVAEIIRVGQNPDSIRVTDSNVTFQWNDGRWLQTQLLAADWPIEMIGKLLDSGAPGQPLPEGFFEALEKIRPFIPDTSNTVSFAENKLIAGQHLEEVSASHVVEGLPAGPKFSEKVLSILEEEITTIDFSVYPNPCGFRGLNSRGIILGQR